MVELKAHVWTLDSGRVILGPIIETSIWGILLKNKCLLAKLFMRDKLNQ